MDNDKSISYCRVCGLFNGKDFQGNDYFPWGKDGNSPSYDICECCGVEFGYEDCSTEGAKAFRDRWIKNGATWYCPEYKPKNWSLEEQLEHIPKKYL